jgi:hypothetical protein
METYSLPRISRGQDSYISTFTETPDRRPRTAFQRLEHSGTNPESGLSVVFRVMESPRSGPDNRGMQTVALLFWKSGSGGGSVRCTYHDTCKGAGMPPGRQVYLHPSAVPSGVGRSDERCPRETCVSGSKKRNGGFPSAGSDPVEPDDAVPPGSYPTLRLSQWSIMAQLFRSVHHGLLLAPRVAVSRFRKNRGLHLKVQVAGDPVRFSISTTDELTFLLAGEYVARTLFGTFAGHQEMEGLLQLRRDQLSRLRMAYSESEIANWQTGGFPSIKEAVLYFLVRRFRPASIIETGVAQGISSCFILAALAANDSGNLTSIDLPNFDPRGYATVIKGRPGVDRVYVKPEMGPGWIVPLQLRARWHLELGPSQEILPRITGTTDFFFHDSLHTPEHMLFEFRWAWDHLNTPGLLVSDDIEWNASFTGFVRSQAGCIALMSSRHLGVAIKTHSGTQG